jgi:hypothetical protein
MMMLTAMVGGSVAPAEAVRYALAAVKLDRVQVAAGGTVWATYTFRSGGPTERPHLIFVHLREPGADRGFGADFNPELPTISWPAEGLVREGPRAMKVPASTAPGRYRLLVGLYETGGERLALDNPAQDDGSRRYLVGEIEVLPAGATVEAKPADIEFMPVDEAEVIDMTRKEDEAKRARRAAPKKPVVLRSDELEVVLDGDDAMPYEYRLPSGARMAGEAHGGRAIVTVCRKKTRGLRTGELAPAGVKATATKADFTFQAAFDGEPAALFVLRYALAGPTLMISLEQVKDRAGYELMSVELPSLATAYAGEGKAWLAYPEQGGAWVDVAKAREAFVRWNTNWLWPAPVAMIGTERVLAVLEAPSYMDCTQVAVTGEKAEDRQAFLGTLKVVREPGGPKTPPLEVGQKSVCRLSVMGSGNWLDGANLVARGLPKIPKHYYDGKLVCKIFVDAPGSKDYVTFEVAGKLIRRIAALIDYAPQVAYLVGWQNEGHDSKYPAVDVVNARLGGYEALMRLMEEGRKVNCVVSFHDNYDDAYENSPAWDPDFIAKNPDGSLMAGGVWAGGQSYIIGAARYAQGPGIKRARYTCERYKIRETYHIDVMSAAPLRSDWDPDHPAGAVANLRGKWAIVDEFARHGVDVTSEGMCWPFLGKMSYFWNSPSGRPEQFGGEVVVPLVATLYRQAAAWGGLNAEGQGPMVSLLYNKAFSQDLVPQTAPMGVEAYYLMQIPWFKLHARAMQSFRRDGERVIMGFGKGTEVDLDFAASRYSVSVDGVEIARDFATFCRIDDGRIAFYSREAKELSAPLPKGWEAAKVRAFALHDDREPEAMAVRCEGRKIGVVVAAHQPVIVYRDGAPRRQN